MIPEQIKMIPKISANDKAMPLKINCSNAVMGAPNTKIEVAVVAFTIFNPL